MSFIEDYNQIFLFLFLLYLSLTILRLYNLLKDFCKYSKDISRLKNGIITLNDIYNLTPNEFEHWCGEFIKSQGFSNIIVSAKGSDGGKDIICTLNEETYYVECKRYYRTNLVDLSIAQKLIGSMIPNNIKNGIIITTSSFTEDTLLYLSKLPKHYNIQVFDGASLLNENYMYDRLNLT